MSVVVTVSAASQICILLSGCSCIFMQICFLHFLEPARRAESDISSAGWLTGSGTYAKQSAMLFSILHSCDIYVSIALALLGPTTYNSIRSTLYPNKGFIKYCMALLGPTICKVFLVFFILKKFCKVFHCHS